MSGNTPDEFSKKIFQILKNADNNQKEATDPYPSATSPDFFLTGPDVFSNYRAKNNVKFLYTGEDYFGEVAKAIDEAKETIYITGWQINYDVLLKTPKAISKKKEYEKLEEELALVEELIQKLYILQKPNIERIIQELDVIDKVDIGPTVKKILKTIQDYSQGKMYTQNYEAEKKAIINYLFPNKKTSSQACPIEHKNTKLFNIEGVEMEVINPTKASSSILPDLSAINTIEICYNDGTCDRIEIKKIIEEICRALKVEERINQLTKDANTGLKDSLWEHLRQAVLKGVKVYVMPWSCPPIGPVKTFDIDTMLATFQLNAGLEEQRAFFTFSMLNSDMGPLAGLFYSHHQKSVIIDHKIGFVGGIDLAYGRRDDKSFNLDASVRFGNDRYNPCIPHTQQALRSTHVSRMALALSTLYNISETSLMVNQANIVVDIKTVVDNWWKTPLSWDVAYDIRKELQPLYQRFNEVIDNKIEQVLVQEVDPILSYYFTNAIDNLINLYGIIWVINAIINGVSDLSVYHPLTIKPKGWVQIPYIQVSIPTYIDIFDQEAFDNLKRKFINGEKYVALNAIARANQEGRPIKPTYYAVAKQEVYQLLTQTKVGQLYSEIMGLEVFQNLPKQAQNNVSTLSPMSILWHTFFLFQDRATKLKEPYYYLDQKLQPLMPTGGITLNDASQPRMPWHDITVKISGPSVYDLSHNFISRWNTSQAQIEDECQPIDKKILLGMLCWAKTLIDPPQREEEQQPVKMPAKSTGLEVIIPSNIKEMLDQLGNELLEAKANIVWLNPNDVPLPKDIPLDADGEEAQVQIIRSAPAKMLTADINAMQRVMEKLHIDKLKQPEETPHNETELSRLLDLANKVKNTFAQLFSANCQTNSKDAWVKAIKGSQYFLYIETQFFQSYYGLDDGYRKKDDQGNKIISGPMRETTAMSPELIEYNVDKAIKEINVELLNWKKLRALAEKKPREFLKLLGKISGLFNQLVQERALQEVFAGEDSGETDPKERNPIVQAIADRIDLAIRQETPYHVYLVIPVHPEGKLNDATVMHTVHLAMQTLVNGEYSLIKSIQRSLCIHQLMKAGQSYPQAKEAAEQRQANGAPLFTQYTQWTDYLTLLNLRTWDKFTQRGITEQIYVHSKMLIADDRIAIVGSANANDRSMLGDRDSELGAIIKGTEAVKVELFGDGKHYQVSKVVHEFRKNLWSKLFAVEAKNVPIDPAFTGAELTQILSQPAAKSTWLAIQKVAKENADAYNKVFNFIPQNTSHVQAPKQEDLGPYQDPDQNYYPLGCSIWPTWSYINPNEHNEGGEIKAPLPFEEHFWVPEKGKTFPKYDFPKDIRGFIVALPIKWTQGENNTSTLHHYIVS
ncbi:phospholipase D-like domain-containing protein [Orbaceae bacterium ac157xtp]